MIRTFRIYVLNSLGKMTAAKAKDALGRVRLSRGVSQATSKLSRKLTDLADLLRDERLAGPKSRYGHWEMTLNGTWPARRTTVAAAPPPRVSVEVTIWLRKGTAWLVVFEANRALCDAAAYLIAMALCGNADAVTPAALDRVHWEAVVKWLRKSEGHLLGGRFYDTRAGGTEFKWIAMRQEVGSDTALLLESLRNSEGIGELMIETPHFPSIDGHITCRLGRSGNLRVYGTEVSDGMVDLLLAELEGVWENMPLKSTQT